MKAIIATLVASVALGARIQDCQHANILGAAYGTKDVTSRVAHHYNLGDKVVPATNDFFGADAASTNTLTIVYERCGNFATVTSAHNGSITLP